MGWSIGYDPTWRRDIGYGVPATCDHPGCGVEIDRGLGYVCGGNPYGGEHGCGLFFCGEHLSMEGRRESDRQVHHHQFCERCAKRSRKGPFTPTPDLPVWLRHKLRDASWKPWRKENPGEVAKIRETLKSLARPGVGP